MIIFLVILAILLALMLLPLGVAILYEESGLAAWIKVGPIPFQIFPRSEKAKPKKKAPPKEDKAEKKGGKLELVKAALPLIKPTLAGVKRRLVIRDLELLVTWAAANPADAAIGYGYANAALGMLWAVIDENFKVKKSRLGTRVDFDTQSPTVYLKATVTTNLWRLLTLILPLSLRFYQNYKVQQAKKTKKEA